MLTFDLNDAGIKYEVALEVLGQSRQPYMRAIQDEEQKPTPSTAFIAYCQSHLKAIGGLQDDLRSKDKDTIERILGKAFPFNVSEAA